MTHVHAALVGLVWDGVRLEWRPVTASEPSRAWVGVAANSRRLPEHRWLWEVVTRAEDAHGAWPIVVAQDVIVVEVEELQPPARRLAAVYAGSGIDTIDIPAKLVPRWPWQLHWYSGWSSGNITDQLNAWAYDRYGAEIFLPHQKEAEQALQFGERTQAESDALDTLLGLPDDIAATLAGLFNYLAERLCAPPLLER